MCKPIADQRRSAMAAVVAVTATVTLAASTARGQTGVAGHWAGEIAIPDEPLAVQVDLALDDRGWHGTIDIPAQGATRLPLRAIAIDGDHLTFTLRAVPGEATFTGRLQEGSIRGQFNQGGAEFPFVLSRRTAHVRPRRPQEPSPPFHYTSEEVRFANGDVRLAGTLTVPHGDPPLPAALLISGSGLQNRDQELFGHKPFWVLADHLSRAGIAVLRVDDAGVGASTARPEPPTTADFADDASAAVDFLGQDRRIGRIGLIGHSEGGTIATMLASRRDDIAFVVLLAAPGVPGTELIRKQNERLFAASGIVGERRETLLRLVDELFVVLTTDNIDESERRRRVTDVVRRQMAANAVVARGNDELVRQAVEQANTPWLRYFLKHDPRAALGLTQVPVLALNGELDTQVDAQQNLTAIAAALREGGNDAVTVRRFAKLNHLFQHATTGMIDEYAAIEETIAPEVLDVLRDWILALP